MTKFCHIQKANSGGRFSPVFFFVTKLAGNTNARVRARGCQLRGATRHPLRRRSLPKEGWRALRLRYRATAAAPRRPSFGKGRRSLAYAGCAISAAPRGKKRPWKAWKTPRGERSLPPFPQLRTVENQRFTTVRLLAILTSRLYRRAPRRGGVVVR